MNPAILYPSRRGNVLQIALFLAMGGMLLWMATDFWGQVEASRQPVALPGTVPDPTPGILFDEQLAQRHQDTSSPGALFTNLMLPVALSVVCIWLVLIRTARLLARKPLFELGNGHLTLRDRLGWGRGQVPYAAIRAISFDRSDRHIVAQQGRAFGLSGGFAGFGARVGGRLRHTLKIVYADPAGEARTIEISDLDVAGGTPQLRRFADYLGGLTAQPVRTAN